MQRISALSRPVIITRVTEFLTRNQGTEYTVDQIATHIMGGHIIQTPEELDNYRRRIYFALREMVKFSNIQARRTKTAFKKSQLLYLMPTPQPEKHV